MDVAAKIFREEIPVTRAHNPGSYFRRLYRFTIRRTDTNATIGKSVIQPGMIAPKGMQALVAKINSSTMLDQVGV